MLEDYAPKPDDHAKDYLNRLRGTPRSMSGLIDDLSIFQTLLDVKCTLIRLK